MIKRGLIFIVICFFAIFLTACESSKPAVKPSDEQQAGLADVQELQQQIEQLKNEKNLLKSQINSLHSVWTADLTGDGKNELITAPPWPTPEALQDYGGALKVEDANGNILLEENSGVLSVAGIYDIGTKTPALIVLQWGGGTMGNCYGAYLYSPEEDALEKLEWEDLEVAVGFLDDFEGAAGSIVIRERGLQSDGNEEPFYERWAYKDGQMKSVDTWVADGY